MPTLTTHAEARAPGECMGARHPVRFQMTTLFNEHLLRAFKSRVPLSLTYRAGASTGLFSEGKLRLGPGRPLVQGHGNAWALTQPLPTHFLAMGPWARCSASPCPHLLPVLFTVTSTVGYPHVSGEEPHHFHK